MLALTRFFVSLSFSFFLFLSLSLSLSLSFTHTHTHTHTLFSRSALIVLKSTRVASIAPPFLERVTRAGSFRRGGVFIVSKSTRIASRALTLQKRKADATTASTAARTSRRRSGTATSACFVRELARIASGALASLMRVAHRSAAAAAAPVRRFRPVRKPTILSSGALTSLERVTLRLIFPEPRFLRRFARLASRRLVFPPFRSVKFLLAGGKHKVFRAVSAGQRFVFERVQDFPADYLLVRLFVHFEIAFIFLLLRNNRKFLVL